MGKNTDIIAIQSFTVPRASERTSEHSGGREQGEQSGASERVNSASKRIQRCRLKANHEVILIECFQSVVPWQLLIPFPIRLRSQDPNILNHEKPRPFSRLPPRSDALLRMAFAWAVVAPLRDSLLTAMTKSPSLTRLSFSAADPDTIFRTRHPFRLRSSLASKSRPKWFAFETIWGGGEERIRFNNNG